MLVRTPISDDVVVDDGETLQITASVTAGTTNNGSAIGTGTIFDEPFEPDQATVTLSGPASVVEGDTTTPYTLNVDFTANTDITVTLSYSGAATNGSDYTGVATATILAGANSATFTLDTIDDAFFEGSEDITVLIASVTGGGFEDIVADAVLNTVTTTITDNDMPTLSISSVTVTEEIDGYAVFTVSLSKISSEDISFNLTLTDGTAAGTGTDFGSPGADNLQVFVGGIWVDATSATIAAGDTSVQVRTPILDDTLADSGENYTLTATVTSGTTTNANASGNGTINDEPTADTALVSIGGPAAVAEDATTTNYTVSVTETPASDITVSLTYSGTAIDGTDFTGVASVIIPGGSASNTFTLDTIADGLAEGVETIVIDIDSVSGGGFEAIGEDSGANQVTTTITDVNTVNWSLTGDAGVIEGAAANYKSVKSILKTRLDEQPRQHALPTTQPITHDNIRGGHYYH